LDFSRCHELDLIYEKTKRGFESDHENLRHAPRGDRANPRHCQHLGRRLAETQPDAETGEVGEAQSDAKAAEAKSNAKAAEADANTEARAMSSLRPQRREA
jgi:hypothetical protein